MEFFANWCPHCQHFAPTWELVMDTFTSSTVQVRVEGFSGKKGFRQNTFLSEFACVLTYYLPGVRALRRVVLPSHMASVLSRGGLAY